jgi:hypothetical protein
VGSAPNSIGIALNAPQAGKSRTTFHPSNHGLRGSHLLATCAWVIATRNRVLIKVRATSNSGPEPQRRIGHPDRTTTAYAVP